MKNLKTTIGQVYLTHPKDANFTTLFEEAFTKNGQSVRLFMVLEIAENRPESIRLRKSEYEKVSQTIVNAFKKTYTASPLLEQDTFEKALAAVNSALARTASQNKVNWYGKLHSVIAALNGNEFSVSSTGNALCYLLRKGEFTKLTEELSENEPKPVKMFSNFASGKLAHMDKALISTAQLFNYLSIERMKEFLTTEDTDEACREIIENLSPVKESGIAAFIFEAQSPAGKLPAKKQNRFLPKRAGTGPVPAGKKKLPLFWALKMGASGLYSAAQLLPGYLKKILALFTAIFKSLPGSGKKKLLFAAIVLIAAALIINIALGLKNRQDKGEVMDLDSAFANIETNLNEAEAALLYDDRNRAASLLTDARNALDGLSETASGDETYRQLRDRLREIENKINKEIISVEPKILTSFSNIPTELLHSPNGFLGFNENTGSLAFYDFRTGEVSGLLSNRNTSDLSQGVYLNDEAGFVFITKENEFMRLNPEANELALLQEANPDADLGRRQLAATFGEGSGARIYMLDKDNGSIWRLTYQNGQIGAPENWLAASGPELSSAEDIAIDGNIYVLFPDRAERFFRGTKENLVLSPVSPQLSSAENIFTGPGLEFIYITDRVNERILVYDKNGRVQKQIRSEMFRDLSDIYVDETSNIIYAVSGEQLLQINLE